MIGDKKILAVIPARGGSKGLPRKNVLPLAGKPLIAWTIEAALACPFIDRLVLSSDDPEIMSIAKLWGCEVPFVRPDELAGDQARSVDVALHALDSLGGGFDYLLSLQPTSPLRSTGDINDTVILCHQSGAPACVTVSETGKSPYWTYFIEEGQRMTPIMGRDMPRVRRQNLPVAHALNGAVHIARIDWLRRAGKFLGPDTRARVMPPERSIDIDTDLDFKLAGLLLEKRATTELKQRRAEREPVATVDDATGPELPVGEGEAWTPYPSSVLATSSIRSMACSKSSIEVANDSLRYGSLPKAEPGTTATPLASRR